MSDSSSTVGKIVSQGTAGDRIRVIADQLKQETSLQIKATSRILGAAAQISENHDRLIDEVVELMEEDLEQHSQPSKGKEITVEQLKRQFKTLNQAKAHFGVKANTWALLAKKLNQQTTVSSPNPDQVSVPQRLDAIENELRVVQTNLNQALNLLKMILKKVSLSSGGGSEAEG
jgi:hypothetical protein